MESQNKTSTIVIVLIVVLVVVVGVWYFMKPAPAVAPEEGATVEVVSETVPAAVGEVVQ